jgi:hypothetical protein
MPDILPVDQSEVAAMIGKYDLGQPEPATVTMFRGQPFAYVPGQGEAELLRVGPWRYTIAVVPGVSINVERDESGSVSALAFRIGGREMRASRTP